MRAIAVVKRAKETDNLQPIEMGKPSQPKGRDLLVKVVASSINPIDMKVRQGVYDDYPDYYDHSPSLPQVIGFDGAGIVESVSPESRLGFKSGDEVYFLASPFRHGTNAEFVLVDERSVAHKPKSLGFTEAAGIPLTALTAWEVLIERLEIRKGENCGILIINGAGGVGAIASQIARRVLNLPVVVTTASRPETRKFSLDVGQATHVVNHHADIVQQIRDLKLDVPIKYFFISHTPTDHYVKVAAEILPPFGKVCSIVQGKFDMYGTPAMAKSLAFVWGLLGTKAYYKLEEELMSHHNALKELAKCIDEKKICHHVTTRLPLTVKALREGHQMIMDGVVIGKVVFSINIKKEGYGEPFK